MFVDTILKKRLKYHVVSKMVKVLVVYKKHLYDVKRVIRAGLTEYDGVVHPEVIKLLVDWCEESEEEKWKNVCVGNVKKK